MEAIRMEARPKTYEVVHLPENPTQEHYEELAEWVLAQDGSNVRHPAVILSGGFAFVSYGRVRSDVTLLPGEYLVRTPSGTWEVWSEAQINESLRVVPHNLELRRGFSFDTWSGSSA